MIEILERNYAAMKFSDEWMTLAIRHSAAMRAMSDYRNEIAGKCHEARWRMVDAMAHVARLARRMAKPTDAEADMDTLQICALQGLQVND